MGRAAPARGAVSAHALSDGPALRGSAPAAGGGDGAAGWRGRGGGAWAAAFHSCRCEQAGLAGDAAEGVVWDPFCGSGPLPSASARSAAAHLFTLAAVGRHDADRGGHRPPRGCPHASRDRRGARRRQLGDRQRRGGAAAQAACRSRRRDPRGGLLLWL